MPGLALSFADRTLFNQRPADWPVKSGSLVPYFRRIARREDEPALDTARQLTQDTKVIRLKVFAVFVEGMPASIYDEVQLSTYHCSPVGSCEH